MRATAIHERLSGGGLAVHDRQAGRRAASRGVAKGRSLRALDIGYDVLAGTIPNSLSCLGNLTSRALSSWLSASVPSELGMVDTWAFARRLPMRHQIVWDDDSGGP